MVVNKYKAFAGNTWLVIEIFIKKKLFSIVSWKIEKVVSIMELPFMEFY